MSLNILPCRDPARGNISTAPAPTSTNQYPAVSNPDEQSGQIPQYSNLSSETRLESESLLDGPVLSENPFSSTSHHPSQPPAASISLPLQPTQHPISLEQHVQSSDDSDLHPWSLVAFQNNLNFTVSDRLLQPLRQFPATPRPTSNETFAGFSLVEKSCLQRSIQRKLFDQVTPPLIQHIPVSLASSLVTSIISGAYPTKSWCYAALAYESFFKDQNSEASSRYLSECLELSATSPHTNTVEHAYTNWLVIEVSFHLELQAFRLFRYVHDVCHVLQSVRNGSLPMAAGYLLWMEDLVLRCFERLWERLVKDIFTPPAGLPAPNIVQLVQQLRESLSLLKHLTEKRTPSSLRLRALRTSVRYHFAFHLLHHEQMSPPDSVRWQSESELDEHLYQVGDILREDHLKSVSLENFPYEPPFPMHLPLTRPENQDSLPLIIDEDLLNSLSLYYITELIRGTFSDLRVYTSRKFPNPSKSRRALGRISSARLRCNISSACALRDLFLARLFHPGGVHIGSRSFLLCSHAEKKWIDDNLEALVSRVKLQGISPHGLSIPVVNLLFSCIALSVECKSPQGIWKLKLDEGFPVWKCIVALL